MSQQGILPGFTVSVEPREVATSESFDMSHLYVIRHGRYDNKGLTPKGVAQIESLVIPIRETIDGGTLYIVSSDAPRAVQGAEILAEEFGGLDVEVVPYLWSASDASEDSYYFQFDEEKLAKIVEDRRHKADGLIVMTHFEVVRDLPRFFMKQRGIDYSSQADPNKGNMHHVDILGKRNTLYLPGD